VSIPSTVDIHVVLVHHGRVGAAALRGCAIRGGRIVLGHRLGVLLRDEIVLDDGTRSPRVDESAKDVHLVVVEDGGRLGQGFEVANFLPLVGTNVVFPEIGTNAGNEVTLF